jgi:glycosyltransferase involved in cell wall biosynthesis
MKKPNVSVIVPVYNVEDYIDDCLDSIVRQTFSDIEILLVVGQSTDNTTYKCRKWCQKDYRIRIIKETQRGLGPARNQGIKEAKGEYIVFVDSDDTIKSTYVEKLYKKIVGEQADLVECDYSKIRSYSEKWEYATCTTMMKQELDIYNKLLIGNVTMWKIMTKRQLWIDNNIVQPEGILEDFFTYPILLFSAKKIVNISEDLYLYRKDRAGSLSSNHVATYSQIANVINHLINECIERNYFVKYRKELGAYIRKWISRCCSMSLGLLDHKQYLETRQSYMNVYHKYFNDLRCLREVILGGFNLSRIVNKCSIVEDPYCRINFTSLISIMSKRTKQYTVKHKNRYRKFMLNREYQKDFFEFISKQKPQFFFFDLLEERHDILQVNNMFFTKSDAFEEASVDFDDSVKIIHRISPECKKMWETSCMAFFEQLFSFIDPKNIIMIKNFLSEKYSDGVHMYFFDEREQIRKMNAILKEYYKFIETNFPNIHVIEVDIQDDFNCTDINYEFGCYPWHLNEWVNIRIAEKIQEKTLL